MQHYFNCLSVISKYKVLTSFYNELNKFYSLNPQKEKANYKKATAYNNASEIFNVYVETYFDRYMAVSDNKKRKLGNKYGRNN